MTSLPRTQYFDALKHKPKYTGRFKAKPAGAKRPVMRYWNNEERRWQYNRRKKDIPPNFGNRPGDSWAGTPVKVGI